MQIEISTRHGGLGPEQQQYLHDKAEKLLKYFGRLMAIEVAVDQGSKPGTWRSWSRPSTSTISSPAKSGPTPESAMDQCVHKIENQLRRYKEKVQHHKGDVLMEEVSAVCRASPSLPSDVNRSRRGPVRRRP